MLANCTDCAFARGAGSPGRDGQDLAPDGPGKGADRTGSGSSRIAQQLTSPAFHGRAEAFGLATAASEVPDDGGEVPGRLALGRERLEVGALVEALRLRQRGPGEKDAGLVGGAERLAGQPGDLRAGEQRVLPSG